MALSHRCSLRRALPCSRAKRNMERNRMNFTSVYLVQHRLRLMAALALFSALPGFVQAQVYNRPTYSSPIAISQNDKLIWAVNPGDNSVSVFRPDSNTRITKIAVGTEPQSVALTPDGQYAWVANAAAGTVSAILISDPVWDTFTASVVTTLITGAEPWNIVTSPDGKRVFVA